MFIINCINSKIFAYFTSFNVEIRELNFENIIFLLHTHTHLISLSILCSHTHSITLIQIMCSSKVLVFFFRDSHDLKMRSNILHQYISFLFFTFNAHLVYTILLFCIEESFSPLFFYYFCLNCRLFH